MRDSSHFDVFYPRTLRTDMVQAGREAGVGFHVAGLSVSVVPNCWFISVPSSVSLACEGLIGGQGKLYSRKAS